METNKIYKQVDAELECEEGSRTVVAVISDLSVDRDQEVVDWRKMKKKNYAGQPVVLVNHDRRSLPIGKALWIKAHGDKLIAKYRISDATQVARDVWGLIQDGTLTSHSIGFISGKQDIPSSYDLKHHPEWADAKLIHRDIELFEFSLVGVPANPNAVALAVAKGLDPETTEFLGSEWTAEDCFEWAKTYIPEETEEKPQEALVTPTFVRCC